MVKRLEDDKELDSLRHQKSEFSKKDEVITNLRKERAEFEESTKREIEAMKSLHQMQLIEAAASRAAEVSAVTSYHSAGSSQSSSAASSASSSPSKDEGMVIAVEGGSPKSKGSGKKKRRVVRSSEEEGGVMSGGKQKSDVDSGDDSKMEDIRELVHELKKSQKKARGLASEVIELKTELDSANVTIKEYQEKLHITSTEIHRFRNMSVSGEADIAALKSHRLRSESVTKADDEEKYREEIEKHKNEAEFHKEEAGKSKEEARAERAERQREKKEYEAHKEEFGVERNALTTRLEEAKREAAAHRERAASVDNHLMSISQLHEKLESSKAERDELTRKLDDATENFIKEEIKSVKIKETVNELQHKLNEKEAMEEECENMRKELKDKVRRDERAKRRVFLEKSKARSFGDRTHRSHQKTLIAGQETREAARVHQGRSREEDGVLGGGARGGNERVGGQDGAVAEGEEGGGEKVGRGDKGHQGAGC